MKKLNEVKALSETTKMEAANGIYYYSKKQNKKMVSHLLILYIR